jgi:hypothetical protein
MFLAAEDDEVEDLDDDGTDKDNDTKMPPKKATPAAAAKKDPDVDDLNAGVGKMSVSGFKSYELSFAWWALHGQAIHPQWYQGMPSGSLGAYS